MSVQLRIRSAQELFAALDEGDPARRSAVLQAVAADPERALAFGRYGERDVLDVLLDYASNAPAPIERRAFLAALAAFRGPRTCALGLDLLAASDDPVTLRLAADCVAAAEDAVSQARLAELLATTQNVLRARLIARLLQSASTLPLAARIRRAVLVEYPARTAALPEPHELAGWLRELEGPLAAEVLAHLEACGEPACRMLTANWDALPDSVRAWLLAWSAGERYAAHRQCIAHALDGSGPLMVRALVLLADDTDCSPELRAPELQARIDDLAHDPRASVRAAAIRAGAQGIQLQNLLAAESDSAVRQACLQRIGRARVPADAAFLAAHLADPDWRVRASAAEALTLLGASAFGAVEAVLAAKPSAETVAAAAQVLRALGAGSPAGAGR